MSAPDNQQRVFTDDDLKRLKARLSSDDPDLAMTYDAYDRAIFGLLARLEAAEEYIQTCREFCCDIYHKEQASAYEEWRKEAGK